MTAPTDSVDQLFWNHTHCTHMCKDSNSEFFPGPIPIIMCCFKSYRISRVYLRNVKCSKKENVEIIKPPILLLWGFVHCINTNLIFFSGRDEEIKIYIKWYFFPLHFYFWLYIKKYLPVSLFIFHYKSNDFHFLIIIVTIACMDFFQFTFKKKICYKPVKVYG